MEHNNTGHSRIPTKNLTSATTREPTEAKPSNTKPENPATQKTKKSELNVAHKISETRKKEFVFRLACYRVLTKTNIKYEIETIMAEDNVEYTSDAYKTYYSTLKNCIPITSCASKKWKDLYQKSRAIIDIFFPDEIAAEELRTQKDISDALILLLARSIPGFPTNHQQKIDIHNKEEINAIRILVEGFVKVSKLRMETINNVLTLDKCDTGHDPRNTETLPSQTADSDEQILTRLTRILDESS